MGFWRNFFFYNNYKVVIHLKMMRTSQKWHKNNNNINNNNMNHNIHNHCGYTELNPTCAQHNLEISPLGCMFDGGQHSGVRVALPLACDAQVRRPWLKRRRATLTVFVAAVSDGVERR